MMTRTLLSLTVGLILVLQTSYNPAHAQKPYHGFKDYKITATFIYKMLKHVDWPKNKEKKRICVTTYNPLDTAMILLHRISDTTQYRNKVEVINVDYTDTEELQTCHVLYVSIFEKGKLDDIISHTQNYPILTVSELRGFAKNGGMVGFVIESGEDVTLQINKTAVDRAKIGINARILNIAEIFS